MAIIKRVFLFIIVNLLVMFTLSIVLNLLNIQPYLRAYGLDYKSLMIFCLIWGMGGAFISLALSRIMAKWMMGVRIIEESTSDFEKQNLIRIVHKLARDAHLSYMPQIGIFSSTEPNAFATGPTQKRSLIAVSSGLIQRMSPKEIEGVLAHEISHIANGDMVTMTLLQGVINAFVMFLARVLAFVFSGLGRDRQDSSRGISMSYILLVYLFEIVFMLLGSIVVATFSRFREYRADKGGAILAGKEKMIAALQSLKSLQKIQDPHIDKPSFEAFKISSSKKSGVKLLFASHPPLDDRIKRLQQMP